MKAGRRGRRTGDVAPWDGSRGEAIRYGQSQRSEGWGRMAGRVRGRSNSTSRSSGRG